MKQSEEIPVAEEIAEEIIEVGEPIAEAAVEELACRNLLDDVQKFTAGNEQNDDITIMSIKLK